MSFTQEQLRAIYAMAMGYGTEAGGTPYQIHVPGGVATPLQNSGWTAGVIQVDFGRQGPTVATNFLNMVKSWAINTQQVNDDGTLFRDFQNQDVLNRLISNKKSGGVLDLDDRDKAIINAWFADPNHKSVFFSTFETPIISLNISGVGRTPGIGSILGDQRFNSLSQGEQTRILVMLDKAANQGGFYGSLQTALKAIKALPDNAFNADGVRSKLAAELPKLAIVEADNVGQVLGQVMASNRLKALFDTATSTSNFDTATVGRSSHLTFLKALLQRAQTEPGDTKDFISKIDAGGQAAYKIARGTVIGVTSNGQLFAVDRQTLSGFTWGTDAGVGSLILDGKSILQDGKTIIERKTINGKTQFVIAGLEGDDAGVLINESGVTTLAKAETFAALLAFDLADADLGEIGSSARQSAADLVRRIASSIGLVDASGNLGIPGMDALQFAQIALRDTLLKDPQVSVTVLGDGQAVKVSGANGTFLLTTDGQVARALTDNQGTVTGFDFLTGAYAGKTVTWNVEGTLTDAQRAALGGSLATALTSGAQSGAIAMIPLDGFNGQVTASIKDRSTGEVLQNVRVSALLDGNGLRIGTLREESRIENGTRITLETRQYVDKQLPALTRVTTIDTGGHSVQTLFANGQFQGITQMDGATVSAGLNEQFKQTLAANGVAAPTLQDMARQGRELGDGANPHDATIRDALTEVKGQAVAGTDYYGNPTLISRSESTLQTVSNGVGSLIDALSLIKAIQTGQPLPIVASGLRLAADLDYLDGTRDLPGLGAAASIAGSVLSLYGLAHALEQGDGVGAITSAAYAVKGAADAAQFLQTSGVISEVPAGLQTAGNAIGEALPYLNLVNSIANGDQTGTVVAVVDLVMMKVVGAYTVPVIGWAYAVYSLVDSLFGDDEPEIPDPWGSGSFVWNGNGISYQSAGVTGGNEAVSGVMSNLLNVMNSLIERERQQNPGSSLGIIPNRMPSVGYDMSGYRYTDIDPLTGGEKHPGLRFDTSGNPYNATPGSPESYQSIIEGMLYSALGRGAIAPLWEVQTAKMQTDAGDPKAGLTEEERAGRDGQLAAPITGSTQTLRAVALDLDGDGIEVTDKAHGVAFDVDDSGYLKQTAWVKGDDGILTLDRNYNGQVDSGREVFSNGTVGLSRRGLAGMAWVDANYDGKLTAADPVWNELKVWKDADQDAQQDAGETQGLAAMGITELNYAMGTFTQNGVKKQLGSPDLEADKDGTQISVVPEGILVKNSADGNLSLIVTRVDDLTAVEANRDGMTGFEDVETIVSSADLLANDLFGGQSGSDLTVTGLTNFRHGTGYVDANGMVHFNPTANYAGNDAGFDYSVRAVNGQTGTARVDVALQGVNDAPTLGGVQHGSRPIYGYKVTMLSNNDGVLVPTGQVDIYSSPPSNMGTARCEPVYSPYYTYRNSTTLIDPANFEPWHWSLIAPEYHNAPVGNEDSGGGHVDGADVDDAASSLTYSLVSQPQYGSVSLNANGTFQYTSWKEPGVASDRYLVNGQYASMKNGTIYYAGNLPGQAVYPTTDVFQVRITDPHGASTVQSISVPHFGPYLPPTPPGGGGGGGKKPIAIDLDQDGFSFTKVDDSNVFFDVNGDGWKHRMSWVKPGDGLLAYDPNGTGAVTDISQIALARYGQDAQSDLEGLAAFDSNHDGVFDGNDADWGKFGVWQDANENGISEAGEFRTLEQMGIASIGLTSDGQFSVVDGNTIRGIAQVAMADGTTRNAADVTLAYSDEVQVPGPDGTSTVVTQSPFSPSGEEIDGTEGNDLLLGKTGSNIVSGYAGDDVIFEDGGNDIIDGGDGNDVIYAGADNDLVVGGNGDDAVYAGLGSDMVFGGDGNDAILAEGGNDVAFGGAGNDMIAGGSGNDVLSGDDGDDQVYGESGNDALFGREGNDTLLGMEGYDRLEGGTGTDLLDGGTEADEMIGGAGNDTYVVDDVADVVTELAGEGNDTVRSSISYALGANVEDLTLVGNGNLTGTGNDLDNVLTGNAGASTLIGGAGNDTLIAGSGATTMIGGSGADTFVVNKAADVVQAQAGGSHTIRTSVSYTAAANVAALIGTGNADITLTGNDLTNTLVANAGDTTLVAGSGAATMIGGAGDNTFVVNRTDDVVSEQANAGIDKILSSVSFVTPEHVEILQLTGADDLTATGNAQDNILIGNAGAHTLDGGAGNDTLISGNGIATMAGGEGNDTFVVSKADDVVAEEAGAGNDTIRTSVSYTASADVENLTGTGSDDIILTGNDLANVITANDGNSTLVAGLGVATMVGGGGGNTFVVNKAEDTVTEQANAGNDTILTSVSYTASANVENLTGTGSDDISLTGNDLANVITSNDGDSTLVAGSGVATMVGGVGDNIFVVSKAEDTVTELAEAGNDTILTSVSYTASANVENLTGTGGNDIILTGNDLANVITSNEGNSTLVAGSGVATMIGGVGDNTFVVNKAEDTVTEEADAGNDTILTSVSYAASANVENLTGTGSDDIILTGNDLANVITSNEGNSTLVAGSGVATMIGGVGNNTFVVNKAEDTVVEQANAGNDTILTSVSYTASANVENLTGTGGDDITLTGNDLANVITSNAGDSTLVAGSGVATMLGGVGDNTFVVNKAEDTVTEQADAGNDTILTSVSYMASANVENLIGTGGDDITLTGNDLANVITSNDGNSTLVAGSGVATMIGGVGDNTFVVNKAEDTVTEEADAGNDTILTSVSYTASANVENLTGLGNDGLVLRGNNLDNRIVGTQGDDRLDGRTGADEMAGGAGNDVYWVDDAGDTTIENSGEGRDAVISSVSYTLASNVEDLTLTGIGAIDGTGNELDNVLIGNAGDNRLSGGDGTDSLAGERGNDLLEGGSGNDTYGFALGDGNDVIMDSDTTTGNIDTLRFIGIAPDDLMMTIDGNDLLFEVHGTADTLRIRNGAANMGTRPEAIERFEFDDGTVLSRSDLWKRIVFGTKCSDTLNGTNASETFYALSGCDTVYARGGHDTAYGSAGNDRIWGGEGDDRLYGEDGDDRLYGEAGNDLLFGGKGNDRLDGGAGNDRLNGGVGDDIAAGGSGSDTYLWGRGLGYDTIAEASGGLIGEDVLMLDASVSVDNLRASRCCNDLLLSTTDGANWLRIQNHFTNAGQLEVIRFADGREWTAADLADVDWRYTIARADGIVTGSNLNEVIKGGNGGDTIDASGGDDVVFGGIGDDRIALGWGNDTANGGSGNDVIEGGDGCDTLRGDAGNDLLNGGKDNDTLEGGAGNDTLYGGDGYGCDTLAGGSGSDTYRWGRNQGYDTIVEADGGLCGEDVLSLDASIRVDDLRATRQGKDLLLTTSDHASWLRIQNHFTAAGQMEVIRFADGREWTAADLSDVDWRYTIARAEGTVTGNWMNDVIKGGAGDDILDGADGCDEIRGGAGNDVLYGGDGNDTLSGDEGNDWMSGGRGDDRMSDLAGNNLVEGGDGNDRVTLGAGDDIVAARRGHDTVDLGEGSNLLLFNKGDGMDVVTAQGGDNAISLGGIRYANLGLSRWGRDLVLDDGACDSIVLRDWYGSAGATVSRLQVVTDGTGDYVPGSSDVLRDNKVEQFDFSRLVAAFDQSTAGRYGGRWSAMNSLLDAHLDGSDTTALGGEVAMAYAKEGSLAATAATGVQTVLASGQFSSQALPVGSRFDGTVQKVA